MAQLALVQNLVISWCHLHCFQSWPPDCVTCIATLPWIALLALSVSIELVPSLARVTSVKSTQALGVTDGETSGPKDRTPGLPGSDKNKLCTKTDKCIVFTCKCAQNWGKIVIIQSTAHTSPCLFFQILH